MRTLPKLVCQRCGDFETHDPDQLTERGWCFWCEDEQPNIFGKGLWY